MSEKYIKNLIKKGEKINVEYKKAQYDLPVSLYETVCSFLNTKGGEILLGVDDKKNIAGISDEKIKNYKTIFGLAEEPGSGVRNVIKYSQAYFGSMPVFNDGFNFITTITHDKNLIILKEKTGAQDKAQDGAQDEEILSFCMTEKSLKELCQRFNYKNTRKFREKYINPLLKKGLLTYTIPDKKTSKNQKYINRTGKREE